MSLLRDVYGQIIIPQSVYEELCEIESQKRLLDQQAWIQVVTAQDREFVETLEIELDKGESKSIALAVELKADFLIIDESNGRQKAESLGIDIVGLLGTLLKAKDLGLLPKIQPIINSLIDRAGFFISPQLKKHVLTLARE
ncbi:DUF3368 domain-containing protein [Persicitalea sp.]|uniref:DUF3368 domain-containing protein n=1 Tax=Persicitalea sp. TaxID=3100273 RepID=UPI00359316E8